MRSLFVLCFFASLIFVLADEGCKQPFSVSATHAPPPPAFSIGMDSPGSGGGNNQQPAEKSCDHNNNVTPRRTSPSFTATAVVDEKFTKVDLDEYFGKWVVLLFYPYDFTFVCPTEILAFSEKNDEFLAINTHVFAISTDSHHTHLAWVRTPRENGGLGKVNIPLIADTSKAISRSFGVLVEDPTDDMYGAALRGLFLIDPLGKVRSMQINDDQVGRSVDETLRLVKAFQYADQHGGEVCPANWKPGDDTIIADPDKSKQYFKRVHGQSQKLEL